MEVLGRLLVSVLLGLLVSLLLGLLLVSLLLGLLLVSVLGLLLVSLLRCLLRIFGRLIRLPGLIGFLSFPIALAK